MFSSNSTSFFANQSSFVGVTGGTAGCNQYGSFDCSEVYSKGFFAA